METTKSTVEVSEKVIEFTMEFIEGLTQEEAAPVIEKLVKGELHDKTDKRVKQCPICNYYFRDKTKPNNSKCCSKRCKTDYDTQRRKTKELDKALKSNKPLKKTKKQTYYYHWFEYPFWIDEREMLRHTVNYEKPFDSEKMQQISAAKQRTEMLGGKRRRKKHHAI